MKVEDGNIKYMLIKRRVGILALNLKYLENRSAPFFHSGN
jgi:hypothetical protein